VQGGGNVKKQNEVYRPCATGALADDRGGTKKRPFHEIVPDGFSISSLDLFERKDVLPLLAQRIARLPLASKKLFRFWWNDTLNRNVNNREAAFR
jgi:hypothetical protein